MSVFRLGLVIAGFAQLIGCSDGVGGNASGTSATSPEWEFATSAAVIGISSDDLIKRLGNPAYREFAPGAPTGGLLFDIGGCKVEYAVIVGKVAHFAAQLGQSCQPSLKGVPEMAGMDFAKERRFAALPAALLGSWRSDCMGWCPAELHRTAYFYHAGATVDAPGLLLTADTVDGAGKVAVESWKQTLGGRGNDVLAMTCGAFPQDVASRLMRDVNISKVSYGTHLNPGPPVACRVAPQLVSMSRDARAPGEAPPSSDTVAPGTADASRGQLIGAWVENETCETDNFVRYKSDGTWEAYGAEGTWTFDGRILTSVTTAEGNSSEGMVPVRNPKKDREIISFTGNDRMVSTWQDKSVHRLKRCKG